MAQLKGMKIGKELDLGRKTSREAKQMCVQ